MTRAARRRRPLRTALRATAAALACALSACSGGGNTGSPAGSSTAQQQLALAIQIPAGAAAAAARTPQFVVPATSGVFVQVYAHADTAHATQLGATVTDVSPGSAACGGVTGQRTCTIYIPAATGLDDVVFTTYDQAPVSGSLTFGSGVHVLARATLVTTIQPGTLNVLSVALGGAVASVALTPAQTVFAAGASATATLTVRALDAVGDTIVAGSADPYNPGIVVAVSESGGSAHTRVSAGGSTPAASVTVTQSSQAVTVSYDGGGGAGYSATITATAGTSSASVTVAPLFATTTSPLFTGGTLTFTAPGQTATFTLAEAGFGGTLNATPAAGCTSVATATTPAAGATSATTIAAGSLAGSCTVTISDGTVSIPIVVANAPGGTGTTTIGIPGLQAYLAEGTSGVAIVNSAGTTLGTIATATSADAAGIDDAGNVYVATANSTVTIAVYPPGASAPSAIDIPTAPQVTDFAVSGTGEVAAFGYDASLNQVINVWDPGQSGAPTRTLLYPSLGASPFTGGVIGHDGTLYVPYHRACGANTCVAIDVIPPGVAAPLRTLAETLIAAAQQLNFAGTGGTAGPDGTVYVTEWSGPSDPLAGLYIYSPSGSETKITTGAEAPQAVRLDGAGNIYIANSNAPSSGTDTAHNIAVLSPGGASLLRRITGTFLRPLTLAVATDGTIFFSDAPNSAEPSGALYVVAPGASTATKIANQYVGTLPLYLGSRAITKTGRSTR